MTDTQKLWGGRFTGRPDETFTRFNDSFAFDRRLFDADIEASIAHAEGIYNAGVLNKTEFARIKSGLEKLRKRARQDGSFLLDGDAEDVVGVRERALIRKDAGRRRGGRRRPIALSSDWLGSSR